MTENNGNKVNHYQVLPRGGDGAKRSLPLPGRCWIISKFFPFLGQMAQPRGAFGNPDVKIYIQIVTLDPSFSVLVHIKKL